MSGSQPDINIFSLDALTLECELNGIKLCYNRGANVCLTICAYTCRLEKFDDRTWKKVILSIRYVPELIYTYWWTLPSGKHYNFVRTRWQLCQNKMTIICDLIIVTSDYEPYVHVSIGNVFTNLPWNHNINWVAINVGSHNFHWKSYHKVSTI